MRKSDLYLQKEELMVRVVAFSLNPKDAEEMAVTLNKRLTEQQKKDGYRYVALERDLEE